VVQERAASEDHRHRVRDVLPLQRRSGAVGRLGHHDTILDPWEGWRPEAEEYRELDEERILVLTRS
jgi:hypothetical protein